MASPHLVQNLKRAPKWAWFTAAGIGVGGAALKLHKGRAAPPDTQTPTDGTSGTDGTQYASGGGATGVIVPPVIMGGTGSGGSDPGLGGLSDLYLGGTQGVTQAYADLGAGGQSAGLTAYGDVVGVLTGLLTDKLGAGGPPETVASNPTPVNAASSTGCDRTYNRYDPGRKACFKTFTKEVNQRQRINGAMRDVKVQQTFHQFKGGSPQLVSNKVVSSGNGDKTAGGPAKGTRTPPPAGNGCFPVGHGPHGVHPGNHAARGKKWAWKCNQWAQVKA